MVVKKTDIKKEIGYFEKIKALSSYLAKENRYNINTTEYPCWYDCLAEAVVLNTNPEYEGNPAILESCAQTYFKGGK